MFKLFFILIFSIFSSFSYSQTDKITGDEFKDLSKIFNQSVFQVDIMDQWKHDVRFTELNDKIDSVIEKNPKWLNDYFEKIGDSYPLQYDSRFGMSEKDFEEYSELYSIQGLESSGKEKLEIILNENPAQIQFNGKNKLESFKELRIDITSGKIFYKDIELNQFENISLNKNESIYNSVVRGYNWSFFKDYQLLDEKKLANNINRYHKVSVTILQQQENGKIFMSIYEHQWGGDHCSSELLELGIMF